MHKSFQVFTVYLLKKTFFKPSILYSLKACIKKDQYKRIFINLKPTFTVKDLPIIFKINNQRILFKFYFAILIFNRFEI